MSRQLSNIAGVVPSALLSTPTPEAQKKVENARTWLNLRRPYYSSLLFLLRPVWVTDAVCRTMGVDHQGRLFLNSNWVEKNDIPQVTAVLLHEVNHVLRAHFERMGGRGSDLWNIATDVEINEDLNRDLENEPGVEVPSSGCFADKYNLVSGETAEQHYGKLVKSLNQLMVRTPCPGPEQDSDTDKPDADGSPAPEGAPSHDRSQDEQADTERQPSNGDAGDDSDGQPSGGDSGGEDDSDGQPSCSGGAGDEGDNSDGQPSGGESDSEADQDGHGSGTSEDADDADSGQQHSCGGGSPSEDSENSDPSDSDAGGSESGGSESEGNGSEGNGSDSDAGEPRKERRDPFGGTGNFCGHYDNQQAMADAAEQAEVEGVSPQQIDISISEVLAQAAETARLENDKEHSKNRGKVPAGLVRLAEEAHKPKTRWDVLLRRYIRNASVLVRSGTVSSMRHPSRRVAHLSKKIIWPGLVRPQPLASVVLDTSGSMSHDDLRTALGEIVGLTRGSGYGTVQVICCDADAHTPQRVRRAEDVILKGGGGTDMTVGIQAALEDKTSRPEVIVVLSDGYTPWPKKETPVPLIAAIIAPEEEIGTGRDVAERWNVPSWAKTVGVPLEVVTKKWDR